MSIFTHSLHFCKCSVCFSFETGFFYSTVSHFNSVLSTFKHSIIHHHEKMEVSGFPHQVGGHFGLLSVAGHVCKPFNHREFDFYTKMDDRLLPFTAKLCNKIKVQCLSQDEEDGALAMSTEKVVSCHRQLSLQLELDNSSSSSFDTASLDSSSSSVATNTTFGGRERRPLSMIFRLKSGRVEADKTLNANHWAGQCQSKVVQKLLKGHDRTFILLEDLVTRYNRPCVIDLKMGTRQYGDDATDQKRLTQTQKCRQSTSSEFGVRLVGMQLFDAGADEYIFVNKYEGRRMDRMQFHNALHQFFKKAGKVRTRRLIEELISLRKILVQAEGFRFFSSSLLISYDGDPHEDDGGITVKMIDFAHSTFNGFLDDKPYAGIDEGYLLGLDSLMRILTIFHQRRFATPIGSAQENLQKAIEKKRAGMKRKLNYGIGDEDEESRSSMASSMYTSDSGTERDEEEEESRSAGVADERIVTICNIPTETRRCDCEGGGDEDTESLIAIA